jgi:acetylglutamate kinase
MKVIKLGGHAMSDSSGWSNPIVAAWKSGQKFVVIHGGGPQIDKALSAQGIAPEFLDGLRVTNEAAMAIVEKTLSGEVLRRVVKDLNVNGARTVGLTGLDAGLIKARPKDAKRYGFVGEITSISSDLLIHLLAQNFLPVISPIGEDEAGNSLNVNADTAAGAIAGALNADEIIFMTDVPGIYKNWPDRGSLLKEVSVKELASIQFEGGMAPKVAAAVNAINSGAGAARIIDGKEPTALLTALTGVGGTLVLP